jgi:hypothetical protein
VGGERITRPGSNGIFVRFSMQKSLRSLASSFFSSSSSSSSSFFSIFLFFFL